jgi:hypothetical protein
MYTPSNTVNIQPAFKLLSVILGGAMVNLYATGQKAQGPRAMDF